LMSSRLGMMFQHGALFSSVSVLENVMYPLIEYTNFSKKTIKELAKLKLTLTGLPSSAFNKHTNELSGGMLKRVALARTLALDPQIIFLDEPTAGLDPNSADALDELIKELQRQLSLTVVMITHDLNSIWNISDELIYMGDKKILLHDTVINAANNTKLPNLYQYFNGKRGVITKAFYTRGKTE
ncbi:MAG: ATP-binding cassette domain-containing protein, partial [Burkholderiales bacterium]|nr:ATP-binding cassette domain-containing protein [Burkholderiales bacterium]